MSQHIMKPNPVVASQTGISFREEAMMYGFLIVLILLMPFWIIWLCFFAGPPDNRKLHEAAERSKCPKCGATLGVAAVERSREVSRAYWEQMRKDHPSIRFRIVQRVYAICTQCSTSLRFEEKDSTFHITEPIGYHGIANQLPPIVTASDSANETNPPA